MKENDHSLPTPQVDAATLNAIVNTLGAVVMCITKHMPPHAKSVMAVDLARLSAQATATGDPLTGTLLADISRAANL